VEAARMEWLVWTGTVVSVLGLLGLVWCIVTVARAKRRKLDDEAMRAHLRKVVPVNMGALLLSALGLMMVVLGIMLG
jgi:protein-S-isoprenylcysteine O-methyltransferase Ste14